MRYQTEPSWLNSVKTKEDLVQKYSEQKGTRIKYQIATYVLAYYFWVTVHIQREFWAMSKTAIQKQEIPNMTVGFFGTLDSCLFLTYSLFQFVSGSLGDNFDKKMVLSVSYIMQAICFMFLGMAGYY